MTTLDQLQALADRGRALMRRTAPPHLHAGEDWYRIRGQDDERAEVFIYGMIGSDWSPEDWTAAAFVHHVRQISAPAIDLHINSPGGLVFDGIAIYSALVNHQATVDVFVDGVAASAASFVAMAGDTVAIEKPAKMMIHDARAVTIGTADDHRAMADLLDDLSNTVADIYAGRAGGTAEQFRAAMRAETWYSAHEAVDAGLADRVLNDTPPAEPAAPSDRRSQLIRARARVLLRGGKNATSHH